MKKLKTILFALLLLFSTQKIISQNIYSGQLSNTELTDLKLYLKKTTKIDLDSISVLTVNYLQPKNYCHYSRYTKSKNNESVWLQGYFQKNGIQFPENSKITTIYNEEIGKKRFRNLNYSFDENHFLHNLMSSKSNYKSCECLLMINKNGKIRIKYGEITPSDAKDFVKAFE